MIINKKYIIPVIQFHPELLPEPKLKTLPRPLPKETRAETLDELPILTVGCELNEV